ARMAYLYQIIQNNTCLGGTAWLDFKKNNIKKLKSLLLERLIEDWEVWQKLPLVHLVEKLIEIFGFTSKSNVQLPYILTFKDIVGNFTADGERGISQFIELLEEGGHKAVLPSSGKVKAIEETTIRKSVGLA